MLLIRVFLIILSLLDTWCLPLCAYQVSIPAGVCRGTLFCCTKRHAPANLLFLVNTLRPDLQLGLFQNWLLASNLTSQFENVSPISNWSNRMALFKANHLAHFEAGLKNLENSHLHLPWLFYTICTRNLYILHNFDCVMQFQNPEYVPLCVQSWDVCHSCASFKLVCTILR